MRVDHDQSDLKIEPKASFSPGSFHLGVSAIILKFQMEKNDIKGFSTVYVSTGTPGSDNKMLTGSTIGIYIKSKMAAKSHKTPC